MRNWPIVRFGDVVQKMNGKIELEARHGSLCVRGGHIPREFPLEVKFIVIGEDYLGPAFHRTFEAGDVLFATRFPNLNKVGQPDFSGICANTTLVLRSNGPILQDFIPWIMKMPAFVDFCNLHTRGSTNPYINWTQLADYEFRLPPETEQKNIIEILLSATNCREKNIELLTSTIAYKRLLVRRYIQVDYPSRLRLESSGKIEKFVELQELTEKITKGSTPTTFGFTFQDEGIPFIRSECVFDSGFSSKGSAFISEDAHAHMLRSQIKSNDILLSITGNIGQACIYPKDWPDGNINQHIARVRVKDETTVETVVEILNSDVYRRYFYSIKTGGAYPQISLRQVRNCLIPIPNGNEFEQLKKSLQVLNQGIDSLEKHILGLSALIKALLSNLLSQEG